MEDPGGSDPAGAASPRMTHEREAELLRAWHGTR